MSVHSEFAELLPLYLYQELTEEQTGQLEAHLASCDACKKQLTELQALHKRLDQRVMLEPSQASLTRLRGQLRSRLREQRRASLREPWPERVFSHFKAKNAALQLLGTAAMLAIGLLAGRFIWGTEPAAGPDISRYISGMPIEAPREALVENIDLIKYEPASGSVTIRYKSVNDVLLQGNVDDASIRKLLVHAIRTENHPGRRLVAVRAVESGSFADKEVERALIYAVEKDTVDGVRLKAAKVLKTFPINPEISAAFVRVLLKDSNPALRMEAIDALSRVQEEAEVVPILQDALNDDENEYIRLRAARELERRVNPQFDSDG